MFKEIMEIIHLTHNYQLNKLETINEEFSKLKDEYNDLKEELDEVNQENVENEEKIEKMEKIQKIKIDAITKKYKNKYDLLNNFTNQLIFFVSVSFLNFLLQTIIPELYCSTVVLFFYSIMLLIENLMKLNVSFFSYNIWYLLIKTNVVILVLIYIYYYLYKCINFLINKLKKIILN